MNKKYIAVFAAILAVTLLTLGYLSLTKNSYTPSANVTAVTDATFEQEVLNSPTPVLIMFHTAGNCPPCDEYKPVFHRAADQNVGKVKFVTIDDATGGGVIAMFGVSQAPSTLYMAPSGGGKYKIGGFPGAVKDAQLKQILDAVARPDAPLVEIEIKPTQEADPAPAPTPDPDKK